MMSEKLCFIILDYQGKQHMKRCFYWKNGLCNESEKGSHSAKKLSVLSTPALSNRKIGTT